MTKTDARKISKAQFRKWLDRNSDPGSLPCVPIICINSLCGDKAGITLNLVQEISLENHLLILESAKQQVEAKIKELAGN